MLIELLAKIFMDISLINSALKLRYLKEKATNLYLIKHYACILGKFSYE